MPKAKRKTDPELAPWPADKVERRPIGDLVPYARNAKVHTPEQVARVAASIREFGWTMPVLVDPDGTLIAGHARLEAAQQLGLEEVPTMVAEGWSDAKRRAYVLADNRLAQADWDNDMLRAEIAELDLEDFDLNFTGFDPDEITQLLTPQQPILDEGEEVPDPPSDPVAKLGDIWQLGRHRVVCGDSTDRETWDRLLGNAVPRLMVTDPPYGVEYDPEWRESAVGNARVGKVSNDDRADWTEVWQLFPGAVAYVWHGGKHCGTVAASMHAADFEIRTQIIWRKPYAAMSRGNYHWQHEPCWYAVRKGEKAYWVGDRKQSTVWDAVSPNDPYGRSGEDKTPHSTQKPLECMARPMRNHDAEEVVDPFLGSGSTLIAAEELGRTCYGIELTPAYVDVIVERWQNRTGETATHEDGRSFDQVRLERSEEEEA